MGSDRSIGKDYYLKKGKVKKGDPDGRSRPTAGNYLVGGALLSERLEKVFRERRSRRDVCYP